MSTKNNKKIARLKASSVFSMTAISYEAMDVGFGSELISTCYVYNMVP